MTTEAVTMELAPVADGVHAWLQPDGSWWLNNAGVIVGTEDVVLIDTCATRRRTETLLAAVDEVADGRPIRLAVNTHMHGDHTYGNVLLPESTVIVAHERTREALLADFILNSTPPIWSPTPDFGVTTIRPPTVVVRDQATLFAGDRRIELRHPGYPAHTEGDLVAWLPDERVLFAGDLLFHQVTPLIVMGSLDGALRSLEWLTGFTADTIVPGHGTLISSASLPDVLATHERYYRFVAETARRGRAAGQSPLAVATETDLGEFEAWPDPERLVLNLHRAYADLAATQVDLLVAFSDAVTWRGGPLHSAV